MDGTAGQKSWRRYGLIISGATIVYGVLVGSYFGVSPPEGSILAKVKLLDLNNFGTMMMISIVMKILHLVLANTLTTHTT